MRGNKLTILLAQTILLTTCVSYIYPSASCADSKKAPQAPAGIDYRPIPTIPHLPDLPVYPGKYVSSNCMYAPNCPDGGSTYTISLTIVQNVTTIYNWYKEAFAAADWTIGNNRKNIPNLMEASRPGISCQVMVLQSGHSATVAITYHTHRKD